MKIESLKEFKALVKACRDLGVSSIDVGDVSIRLGQLPIKRSNSPAIDETAFPEASIKVPAYDGPISDVDPIKDESFENLTEDQKLFYSAQGHDQVEQ